MLIFLFQVVSSVTASLRFQGALNVDLNEIQTNLVAVILELTNIFYDANVIIQHVHQMKQIL